MGFRFLSDTSGNSLRAGLGAIRAFHHVRVRQFPRHVGKNRSRSRDDQIFWAVRAIRPGHDIHCTPHGRFLYAVLWKPSRFRFGSNSSGYGFSINVLGQRGSSKLLTGNPQSNVPSDNTQSASENLESRFERVLKPNARKSVPAHDAFDRTTGEIQQMFGWTNKLVGIGITAYRSMT